MIQGCCTLLVVACLLLVVVGFVVATFRKMHDSDLTTFGSRCWIGL